MTSPPPITPGQRFAAPQEWEARASTAPHLWRTLGYRTVGWEPGSASVAWQASPDYGFPVGDAHVVQGGLVTALLDGAMGASCWTVLDLDQNFMTADLRVEFYRPARPGPLRAVGRVERRTRRVVFCSAQLFAGADVTTVLAASRCTQIVIPVAPTSEETT
jgi:uncharacterized protein (TIGR00369 family)